MTVLLEIDNGDGRGRVDYTRYLVSPERSPATLRDRINEPALLDFSLAPADATFIVPVRSAYVRLSGLVDAPGEGFPREPGAIFTGYITADPAADFLGTAQGQPLHGWRCQATSEEYLLNVKRIGWLPPFLNQSAGAILSFFADRLQPGRFDTSTVADGPLLPRYTVRPDALWSDVARDLAERVGFIYRVLDGKIIFQPIGSSPAGITIDESARDFRPEALELSPVGNPIQNDVTVVGGIEPQAYVKEYFVGDGFTSRFPLSAPVFGAQSELLLADEFTGASLDRAKWTKTDPAGGISLFQGRLNVTGGTGVLGETVLQATQGVELGGHLELLHGEFEVVSPASGILGGLYDDAALQLANCLLGFEISPLGASSRLRGVVNGVVQAPEIPIQQNHHYLLLTRISADQAHRTEQLYPSTLASYGSGGVAATIRASLVVQSVDLAQPNNAENTTLFEGDLTGLPGFAIYAPINASDLHVAVNFLQMAKPIQALLVTEKPGELPQSRRLGFGIAQPDATITADPNQNQWALEFYEDTIPVLGEKLSITYRAAGTAVARVTDANSIASEALRAGDDGRRAVILQNVSPQPRSAAECELAAQAYLDDHTSPRYEGRYSTWSLFAEGFPRSGTQIAIRNPSRQPEFTALVRSVTSELRELGGEHILHTLEFGQPTRFEDLLKRFASPPDILAPEGGGEVVPEDRLDVGTAFIADAPSFVLASFNSVGLSVDMGAPPPPGGVYEVRRGDQGWSTAAGPGTTQNRIGAFSTQTFSLPRGASRNTFHIRPVAASGETSRYSSILSVQYPPVPAAPQNVAVQFGSDDRLSPVIRVTVEIAETSLAGVQSVELRDSDNNSVLARWDFGQLQYSGGFYRATWVRDNSATLARSATFFAATQNTLGEFSPARSGSGTQPQPAKPFLTPGNSVGQILEILLDTASGVIFETQMQIAPPGGDFAAPAQDVLLAGQPEKFSFVATHSGGWSFRGRRRDSLGWSPWSDEAQGQIPPQALSFLVQFFHADELDPSIGAAVNGQNLLPNSEFFLSGVAGQEGTHVAKYFALVSAVSTGAEVDFSSGSNEMRWKSGVNFAGANPGFRSLLSNLGRLLNPGEAVTFSAALRHSGSGGFSRAVRLALRSPGTPSYDQTRTVPLGSVTPEYRWYSAVFQLPANQAVPDDLSFEITAVIAAGQSLSTDLFCDKAILNRGQRPAAFSLAPWDVVSLTWNSGAGAYDLPATVAGGTPRSSDPGNAGLLAGTGTEDLDPDFLSRYVRFLN